MTTLAELRHLHEAATPGPWRLQVTDYCGADGTTIKAGGHVFGEWADDELDPRLIVAMRNSLPALFRCIEAADDLARDATVAWDEDYRPDHMGSDIEAYRQARAELEES